MAGTGARTLDASQHEGDRATSRPQGERGLYGSEVGGANLVRAATAELIGTFILVFVGISVAVAAILERGTAGPAYDSLAIALAFGVTLAALVAALGHVSGAHLNPAVTVGLTVTGKFPARAAALYVVAQLAGAILAGLACWAVFGDPANERANLAATFPQPSATILQALLVEAIVTFILVFVVLAVATDDRAPAAAAPLAVGFALAAGVFAAGPISGGAVNPARALGPMIAAGAFDDFWVYLVGPLVGGTLAALIYDRFVRQADAPA